MQAPPTSEDLVAALASIWSEALGTAATTTSDFFALGGTSLSAVSIASAVAERYVYDGIELFALQAVFEQPSLSAMAGELRVFIARQLGHIAD